MKKVGHLLIIGLLAFSVAGCTPSQKPEDVPPPPKTPKQEKPSGDSTKKVVKDYANGLTGSLGKVRKTQTRAEMDALRDAVQNYYIDNGRYPSSLEEISDYEMGGTDLSAYNYDPNTGKITLK